MPCALSTLLFDCMAWLHNHTITLCWIRFSGRRGGDKDGKNISLHGLLVKIGP